jgi:hypothetical protein
VGFGSFLAQLEELFGFVTREGIQIDAIHGLIEVLSGILNVALGAGALAKRIETRECILWVGQQELKLIGSFVPAFCFLIEPAKKVARISAIDTGTHQLFAECDGLVEPILLLELLRLAQSGTYLRTTEASAIIPATRACSSPACRVVPLVVPAGSRPTHELLPLPPGCSVGTTASPAIV